MLFIIINCCFFTTKMLKTQNTVLNFNIKNQQLKIKN
jgi:hypothetical protein